MKKSSDARPESGVVDKARVAVQRGRELQRQLEEIPIREDKLRQEVMQVEEATSETDIHGLEVLNALRVRLSCVPGTRRRLEKEIVASHAEVAELLPALKSFALDGARREQARLLERATTAMRPFYSNDDDTNRAALASPALAASSSRIYRAEYCDALDASDVITAAERILAVIDEPAIQEAR
jgi:hypothetical protein